MSAEWLVARARVRSERASLLGTGLAIAVLGAVVLALVAGARRTETAIERFRSEARAADIEVLLYQPADAEQLAVVRSMPGVEAVAQLHAYAFLLPAAPAVQTLSTRTDDEYGTTVDRGRIITGRAASPDATDEITLNEPLAAAMHVGVGDTVDLISFSRAQVEATLAGEPDVGPPAGMQVALRLVGVERRPLDLGVRGEAGGIVDLPRAFDQLAATSDVGLFGSRLRIRTAPGRTQEVLDSLPGVFGQSLGSAEDLATESEGPRADVAVSASALRLMAIALAVTAIIEIGLLLDGRAQRAVREKALLLGLGVTTRQRVVASVMPIALVAACAAVGVVAGAVLLSRWFPIGAARRAEPRPGVSFDGSVLVIGTLVVTVAVVALATLAALRAERHVGGVVVRSSSRRRSSGIASVLSAIDAPVSAWVGARIATTEGWRRRTTLLARATTALGIVGVLGATIYVANLMRTEQSPSAVGATFDRWLADESSNVPCGVADPGIGEVRGVASSAELCTQSVLLDGRPVTALAYRQLSGSTIDPTIIEGRAPTSPSEIAIGTATLRRLDARLGQTVEITGHESVTRRFTIVGRAAFAATGSPQALAEGVALTWDAYAPLFDINVFTRTFVVRFDERADRSATTERLAALPDLGPPQSAVVPVELGRLVDVRWIAAVFAVATAAIALGVLVHLVGIDVGQGRRELAVLAALGVTRRGALGVIGWYAVAMVSGGLVIGGILGIVAGRGVWTVIADHLGVADATTVPWAAVPIVIGVALGVSVLAAIVVVFSKGRSRRFATPGSPAQRWS